MGGGQHRRAGHRPGLYAGDAAGVVAIAGPGTIGVVTGTGYAKATGGTTKAISFGIDPVNARLEALGLENTHLYKKVSKPATEPMPADQPKFGLGKTTPREMATLMETIGLCHLHQIGTATTPGAARFAELTRTPVRAIDPALRAHYPSARARQETAQRGPQPR